MSNLDEFSEIKYLFFLSAQIHISKIKNEEEIISNYLFQKKKEIISKKKKKISPKNSKIAILENILF